MSRKGPKMFAAAGKYQGPATDRTRSHLQFGFGHIQSTANRGHGLRTHYVCDAHRCDCAEDSIDNHSKL